MAQRRCKYPPDSFCYVCGHHTQSKVNIEKSIKFHYHYEKLYGLHVKNLDKPWTPNVACRTCYTQIMNWGANRRPTATEFNIPRLWLEPSNHLDDCFFCAVDLSRYKKCGKEGGDNINYPNLPSSCAPRVNDCELIEFGSGIQESETFNIYDQNSSQESCYSPPTKKQCISANIHKPDQKELNDLIRDLGLTKEKGELLTSRMKSWNLVQQCVNVTVQRSRHAELSTFYCSEGNLCYCSDVDGLFTALDIEYIPHEWRLFIDSSSLSLKAVLLHIGNKLPSIPVGHSTILKENYTNVKFLLNKLNYEQHSWLVCGDFKMIGFLTGLQGGYTKHSCFLCLWDSRADSEHFVKKDWPLRQGMVIGTNNILNEPLVSKENILLPPLHIKLGLMKQFVKSLDKEGQTFLFLKRMFPSISDAKLQAGIFVGPQIRRAIQSDIEEVMTQTEKNAWRCFKKVISGFLGNRKDEHAKENVQNLVKTFGDCGCRMSLKLHFLFSHFDFFSDNMGDISEEHGERFHQDIKDFEKRYQGHWNASMMGDYVWSLVREDKTTHKRKTRSSIHF